MRFQEHAGWSVIAAGVNELRAAIRLLGKSCLGAAAFKISYPKRFAGISSRPGMGFQAFRG